MVDQLPNRGLELEMLNEMGFSSIDDLFSDLPEHVRMQEALPLPPPAIVIVLTAPLPEATTPDPSKFRVVPVVDSAEPSS